MSWNRATSRDFSFLRSDTPEQVGPGSYDVESSSPRCSRISSACFKTNNARDVFSVSSMITPSPADYNQTIPDTRLGCTSAFKSSSKRRIYDTQRNPGPADYGSIHDWSPKSSRGKKVQQFRERPVSPNVGQDVLGYQIAENGRVKPVRKKINGEEWVGPGSYSPEDLDGNKTGPAIGERFSGRDAWLTGEPDVPGPGRYTPRNVDSRYKRKIPKSRDTDNVVAPKSEGLQQQTWATKSKSQTSTFKSRSGRQLFPEVEKTPSPAAYRVDSGRKGPTSMLETGFGYRSPRFDNHYDNTPGPGAYNSKNMQWGKKGNALVRKAVDHYGDNDVPGPGAYSPKQKTIRNKDRRPTSSFASRSKRGWTDGSYSPGPGAYNVEYSGRNSKMTIRASRFKETNNFMFNPYANNPSPADYQRINDAGKRGVSIPRSGRFDIRNDESPGPGSYDVVHSSLIKKSSHIDFRGIS